MISQISFAILFLVWLTGQICHLFSWHLNWKSVKTRSRELCKALSGLTCHVPAGQGHEGTVRVLVTAEHCHCGLQGTDTAAGLLCLPGGVRLLQSDNLITDWYNLCILTFTWFNRALVLIKTSPWLLSQFKNLACRRKQFFLPTQIQIFLCYDIEREWVE